MSGWLVAPFDHHDPGGTTYAGVVQKGFEFREKGFEFRDRIG